MQPLKLFQELSTRQRLFAFVLVFSGIIVLITLWSVGVIASLVVVTLILGILILTKNIWLPDNHGNTTIRRLSLGIVLTVGGTFPFWNSPVSTIVLKPIIGILAQYLPQIKDLAAVNGSPSIAVLLFTLVGVFIVNYNMRDRTAMGIHHSPIDIEFPERDYQTRLRSFCKILKRNLEELNRETNWSEEHFTPIDAEVEIYSKSQRKRRITDLLSALKASPQTKVYLVLGDPGSGKSVALRKLCSELLDEVDITGKVPIYVNLREWEIKEKWSESKPPTQEQLYCFVVENLKSRGDLFSNEFIDKYFRKMFEHGRLFFILDSFDEIPSVMDVDESSWLIDSLSLCLYRFLASATDSGGVLASRIFRKPTHNFSAEVALEIRPFSENQILWRFKKNIDYDAKLEKLLFRDRQEFLPIARNPFTASLIINYAKKHDYKLPNNQSELYSSYVFERLESSRKFKESLKGLNEQDVLDSITEIAYFMFTNPKYGLEAPQKELANALTDLSTDAIIDILCFIRLGRVGKGEDKLFSFVHRRFNEFLVARKLIKDNSLIPKDSIPTDSRWRDSLVLFCEVSGEKEASELANSCWLEIKKVKDEKLTLSDPTYLRAIHSLRFLKDAFRTRTEIITPFQSELTEFIINQISSNNLLESKLSIESVGLIDHQNTDKAVRIALDLNNPWISENAIRSCRHLPALSDQLEARLKNYILKIRILGLLKRKDELRFSFTLSDGFKRISNFFENSVTDCYLCILGVILVTIASPLLGISILIIPYFGVELLNNWAKYSKLGRRQKLNDSTKDRIFERVGRILLGGLGLDFMMRIQIAVIIAILLTNPANQTPMIFNYIMSNDKAIVVFRIFLITGAALIAPWFHIFVLLQNVRYLTKKRILEMLTSIGIGTALMAILYVIVSELISEEMMKLIAQYVIVCGGLIFAIITFRALTYSLVDHFWLTKLKLPVKIERKEIANMLEKLKSPYGRRQLVLKLEPKSIQVTGNWANNEIPNYQDEASTLLAQLEERWLGFER